MFGMLSSVSEWMIEVLMTFPEMKSHWNKSFLFFFFFLFGFREGRCFLCVRLFSAYFCCCTRCTDRPCICSVNAILALLQCFNPRHILILLLLGHIHVLLHKVGGLLVDLGLQFIDSVIFRYSSSIDKQTLLRCRSKLFTSVWSYCEVDSLLILASPKR